VENRGFDGIIYIMESCRFYHPNSELKDRSGYYPNLNERHLQSVREFKAKLEAAAIDLGEDDDGEQHLLKILRFLRARQYNVSKSFEMFQADIKWWKEEERIKLRNETAEEILGCDLKSIYKYFPAWIQGTDRQCRPVAWRKFGKFEIWNVLKLTTMEKLLRFHAWEAEQALKLMNIKSVEVNYNIETFVIIIDALGWHFGLATGDAYAFIKGMLKIDSDHYPERLGRLVIINAPAVLSIAWRVISPWLDPVTKTKISIVSTDKSLWLPVLLEMMDKEEIPQQYGGDAPDPEEGQYQVINQKEIQQDVGSVHSATISISSILVVSESLPPITDDENFPNYQDQQQEQDNINLLVIEDEENRVENGVTVGGDKDISAVVEEEVVVVIEGQSTIDLEVSPINK